MSKSILVFVIVPIVSVPDVIPGLHQVIEIMRKATIPQQILPKNSLVQIFKFTEFRMEEPLENQHTFVFSYG